MNSDNGGLSPDEQQRKTATEIARKRVLAAYSATPTNTGTMKQSPVDQGSVQPEQWKQYHSAWQNYYQKYYSEYYSKAAKQYVETEKLKNLRQHSDSDTPTPVVTNPSASAIIHSEPSEHLKDDLRIRIQNKATAQAKITRRHRHLIPIFAGVAVVLVFLFLQYNRLIFAPIIAYISPGNVSASELTAIDPTTSRAVGPDPKLIIPKLNIDVPINFNLSNDEKTIMDAMNHGVAHFAIPGGDALPGQNGNLIITGHSAGDIYSDNQYKFIFSGLERLVEGDTIHVNYQSKRYTYSVAKFKTVEPTDIASLTSTQNRPQLILITCTPLGTSRYRLLVFADQIDPSPDSSTKTSPQKPRKQSSNQHSTNLPSNEPDFITKIWKFLTNQP